MTDMANIEELRQLWTDHYSKTLPNMARVRHPVQSKWPVTLDHCFARIILDKSVGNGMEQWDRKLNRPAVKNMSAVQLQSAIELAERIENGKEDLVALDLQSLQLRGKAAAKYPSTSAKKASRQSEVTTRSVDERHLPKRKQSRAIIEDDASYPEKKARPASTQSTLNFRAPLSPNCNLPSPPASEIDQIDWSPTLSKIKQSSSLTPYRKRLYAALISVPKGRYTTYAALSDYLGSSARAVGNGMRNNPFAPDVPCHRVLASDGSIGGFRGSWGADGKNASKKLELLHQENVTFDSLGRVKGPVFRDFSDLLAD